MFIISSSSPSSLNPHLQTLKAKKAAAMLIRIMNLMFLFIVFSSVIFVGDCLTSDVHDGETVYPTPPGSDEKCTCSPCGGPCNNPRSPPPSPPSPPPPLPTYNPPSAPYCPPPPYYASPTPPDYISNPPPPYSYGQTPPSPNYVWKPPGSLYPVDPNYNLSSNRRSFSLMLQAFLCCVLLALLKFF